MHTVLSYICIPRTQTEVEANSEIICTPGYTEILLKNEIKLSILTYCAKGWTTELFEIFNTGLT